MKNSNLVKLVFFILTMLSTPMYASFFTINFPPVSSSSITQEFLNNYLIINSIGENVENQFVIQEQFIIEDCFQIAKEKKEARKRLIEASKKYIGNLQWHQEACDGWFTQGTDTSDFKILIWSSACKIPEEILIEVRERKARILLKAESGEKLQMCCWEFCFSSMVDAGILTEAQMDRLCLLAHIEDKGSIVKALYRFKGYLKRFSFDNLPQEGDMIFFFDPTEGDPRENPLLHPDHVAIWLGNMQCIDLAGAGCWMNDLLVTEQNLIDDPIFFVSLDDVSESVDAFIQLYAGDEYPNPLYKDVSVLSELPR